MRPGTYERGPKARPGDGRPLCEQLVYPASSVRSLGPRQPARRLAPRGFLVLPSPQSVRHISMGELDQLSPLFFSRTNLTRNQSAVY